ncbi:MAG: retron Ec67 family RNA-directed DNA polymerase/endonuclease [Clostridia bacterium]|nr:retron Ec67 family RNA-directed DNA polymerase/endonuclease [Clostridia bacterium]
MKLSEIRCREDLACLLKIKTSSLTYVLYRAKVNSFYKTFDIPKKNGGVRQINAPTDILKIIQERLASAIYSYMKNLRTEKNINVNIAHAFEKKKSIITNAQIHKNKYIVLTFDLEHFFDSFHFGRVAGFFEKNRDFHLPHNMAIILAQLTCYNGHLPQGAPTSPIITNLIFQICDMRILKLAKKYKLDYTRYADDLTFSTNNHSFIDEKESFQRELEREIGKAGFSINQTKTRMSLRNSRQEVTGLVVNKKINVNAGFYRKTRAMAHQLYQNGSFTIDGKEGSIQQLEGRFAFIDQLDHYNNKIDGKIHSFRDRNGREKQYSKFLFYKFFYANEKPLIVTEGKTDIRYLKAALKSLYLDYPELISRNKNGSYTFKVQFLHRTKRLSYFLDIAVDGAKPLYNIYKYFIKGRDSAYPNYYKFFSKDGEKKPRNPVVILLDNEMKPNKPLKGFLDQIKSTESEKNDLQQKLSLRLLASGNLYLLTNPLVDNKDECEIELLFTEETRGIKLEGKSLCLEEESFEKSNSYGKNIFSNYILQHYNEIDFSRFIPLLNALSSIIKNYSAEMRN